MTKSQIWQRIVSRSYVASLPVEKLKEVKGKVDAVIAQHENLFAVTEDGSEPVAEVPLRLEIFIARKKS